VRRGTAGSSIDSVFPKRQAVLCDPGAIGGRRSSFSAAPRRSCWRLDGGVEAGRWFKGCICQRRCDLFPGGDLLISFAVKRQGPLETWIAVSRTPYLTALALLP